MDVVLFTVFKCMSNAIQKWLQNSLLQLVSCNELLFPTSGAIERDEGITVHSLICNVKKSDSSESVQMNVL